MSTLQTRTSLILPDDGGPGGDDTVNVTTQLSDSIDYLSNGVGAILVANFAALPGTQNFPGRLAQTLDDGAMWIYNAGWKFWHDTREQTSWKPGVEVQTGPFTIGAGGDRFTRYTRIGTWIEVTGWCYTGTTGFAGGQGAISFKVPYAMKATNSPAWGSGSVNAHGEDFQVYTRIDPSADDVKLYALWYDANLSQNNTRVRSIQVQNCDNGSGGAAGTGIPRFSVPTNQLTWDVSAPGYFNWQISYHFDINSPVASTP